MDVSNISIVNQTLLAAIYEWTPWISYNKTKKGKIFALHGVMVNFLEHFKKNLKIRFDYVEPPDGFWGQALPNGSFNGMVGMVHRNEVHVAVGPFIMDYFKMRAVDFSSSLYMDSISILVGKQNHKHPLFPVLHVFNGKVWLVLFLLLLTCFLIYALIGHNTNPRSKADNIFSNAFIVFISPLFNTWCPESKRKAKRQSQRILITFWKIGSRFLCLGLSAVLLSAIIVTKPADFIKTFQDIERFPEAIPILEKGTTFTNMLELNSIPSGKEIWRKIQINPMKSLLPYDEVISEETLSKVLKENDYFIIIEYAGGTKALHDRFESKLPCGFHITSLIDFGAFYAFIFNKYLPSDMKENLTYLAINVVENGLLAHDIERSSSHYDRCIQKLEKERIIQIKLKNLLGTFIFHFSGLLCGLVYFLQVERKINRCKNGCNDLVST